MKIFEKWLKTDYMDKGGEVELLASDRQVYVKAGEMARDYAARADKKVELANLERDLLANQLEEVISRDAIKIARLKLRIAELEISN